MTYGYVYIDHWGEDMEAQISALFNYNCYEIIREESDCNPNNRNKFYELINSLRSKDCLIVGSIEALGLNTSQFLKFLILLIKNRIHFKSVMEPDFDTENPLTLAIFNDLISMDIRVRKNKCWVNRAFAKLTDRCIGRPLRHSKKL